MSILLSLSPYHFGNKDLLGYFNLSWRSRIGDREAEILDRRLWIGDCGSEIVDQSSWTEDWGPEIGDQRSGTVMWS